MKVLAFFVPAPDGQPVQVEVLDIYHPLCSVRAISGKPFVGGDKWPIHTEYAVVPIASIEVVSELVPQSHYQPNQDSVITWKEG
jgi:hypothetical protein